MEFKVVNGAVVTIGMLGKLVDSAKEGKNEVQLLIMLASMTLEPKLTEEEYLALPAKDYASIKAATAQFQSDVAEAFK